MPRGLLIVATATVLSLALAQGDPLPHHRIALDAADVSDLAFLDRLLEGVRVVQLGEDGHGMAESSLLKTRLVRYLHERLGFGVLAFESSLYLCHKADRQAGTTAARSTLTGALVGVWHTEEVLPLFAYIRQTRETTRPLRLAGFDVQPIGSGKKDRPAFFARVVGVVDAAYAQQVEAFDAEFISAYDKGQNPRRTYFREHGAQLVEQYSALATFIEKHRKTLSAEAGREVAIAARQEARSMAAYVRYQVATEMKLYAEIRDEAMAANVRAITEDMFPGEKVIVWGHNYHLRHANERIPPAKEIFPGVPARSMGGYLKPALGDALYTVGIQAFTGEAMDNARTRYDIPPASKDSLEERLVGVGGALAFFDLRSAAAPAAGRWLSTPVEARYNARFRQQLVPTEQYDAVIVIGKVQPPTFLY